MLIKRIWLGLFSLTFLVSLHLFAAEIKEEQKVETSEPEVGSWTFSGTVTNESGDRYGYFFQLERQGSDFHAKTALIDAQNNKLLLFYEGDERIENATQLNWHVGRSFMRYNPINDSWVFGIKDEHKKGFNFKVDMLKGANRDHDSLALRPGIELQAVQTSQLNGHVQLGEEAKEQFVTANKAWFGKLWYSKDQKAPHDISTTFCRLSNDTGFFSANLKEADATRAAVTGWRDELGNKVKMSQFISIKSLSDNQSVLSVALPKLSLKLSNTLINSEKTKAAIAGFTQSTPKSFCYVNEQSFKEHSVEAKA